MFNPYMTKYTNKSNTRNKKYDSDILDKKQIDDLEYGDMCEGLPVEVVPKGHIEKLDKIQQQMGVGQCLMMGGSNRTSHAGVIQIHDKEKYKRQHDRDKINKKESAKD